MSKCFRDAATKYTSPPQKKKKEAKTMESTNWRGKMKGEKLKIPRKDLFNILIYM